MKHIEGNFTGLGGLNIYTQAWLPEGDPRATILLVHDAGRRLGLGSHVGDGGDVCGQGGCSPGALFIVNADGATPAAELLPFVSQILGWLPE